jgi:signal transduction histidine kinase
MTSNHSPEKDMTVVLASLKDIAEAVMHAAEAATLEEVLERIAEVSQRLVGARYVALGVPDGMGSLRFFKVVGLSPETIEQIGHLPVGRGLLGVIMNERQVLRLEDMSHHARSVGFPPNHPPMKSLLGVPIQLGQQLFGMLYLCDRYDGHPFTEQDQWLVETLAGYAALGIAGVQLSEQNGRLILLEERERVARELHDGIIQSLYAIGMQLQIIRLSQAMPDANLATIIGTLDGVIEDIRRYILNLKVTNYEQRTVQQALEDVVARLHIPPSLPVTVDAPRRIAPFPPPVLEAVCQIANEAISNAVRHAAADHINITAQEAETFFQLTVEDNGQGFSETISDHEGLGLRNIQQRARIHGGNVRIQTEPGQGTKVILTIPLTK